MYIMSWMRPKVKKGRIIMENAIKDQLVQKEKEKNAEQLERLYKLDNAVMSLTCDIREALCFIRPMIDTAVSYSPYDTEAISDLLCALPMITKILMDILTEAETADNI
jgi:hypothetical protein